MIIDRYYYNRLSEIEKTIYKNIYSGCKEHRELIRIEASSDQVMKHYKNVVDSFLFDNPLLYYVDQNEFDFKINERGEIYLVPQYFYNQEQSKRIDKAIQNDVNRLIIENGFNQGSDSDKVRKVHDYFCQSIEYDYASNSSNPTKATVEAHSILGVFRLKKARCEGIAKAVKVILNAVDVGCIFVSGKARNKTGKYELHGWNIVNIDKTPYHLDTTFDIGTSSNKNISYDYYNISDIQIKADHVYDVKVPICGSLDANYFVQNNLYFNSIKRIEAYIANELKMGNRSIYFMVDSQIDIEKQVQSLIQFGLEKLLCNGGKDVKCLRTINKFTGTCRLVFS